MSAKDLDRWALLDAQRWQTSIAEAFGRDTPEHAAATKRRELYEKALKRRHGIDLAADRARWDAIPTIAIRDIKA